MQVLLWSWLLGCTGGGNAAGGPTYTLNLATLFADDQDPFEGADRIDLVLDTPGSAEDRRTVEFPGDGSVTIDDLPPLADTSVVVETYAAGEILGRGRSSPLTATDGDVTADMFVGMVDEAARFAELAGGLYRPAVAPLGDGRFVVAGGMANTTGNNPHLKHLASGAVYTLQLAPPDAGLTLVPSDKPLPDFDLDGDTVNGRFGATLTPLTASGPNQGKLLLVGGSLDIPFTDAQTVVGLVSLYDPDTGTWEDPLPDELADPRSMHLAIENEQGDVVIWGGWRYFDRTGYISVPSTIEIFDHATSHLSTAEASVVPGPIDAAMTDVGSHGTLICGGGGFASGDNQYQSVDICDAVGLDGRVSQPMSLAEPTIGHAMITLPDGRILVTGGVESRDPQDLTTPTNATAHARLYDPYGSGNVTELPDMNMARAGHRMTLLPDGRVLIAGGGSDFAPTGGTSNALSCLEIFDTNAIGDENPFTLLGNCNPSDSASGLNGRAFAPEVATDPDFGVLVVGGMADATAAQSQVNFFVPAP